MLIQISAAGTLATVFHSLVCNHIRGKGLSGVYIAAVTFVTQDLQYRSSVAWQNNCYNQTGYPSFYYGPDMDWGEVR